jgi:hypothetical protein
MSFGWVSLLLAAAWTDPTGRLRCEVPDAFTPLAGQPWRFTRGDGLRQLVFLTVKPVPLGPAARAREMLEKTGAGAVSASGPRGATGTLPDPTPAVSVALAIAELEPTWAGVVVLGPPAADLAVEAGALAAGCRKLTPSISHGRAFDATRRLSAEVPPGHDTLEIRGAGAVQGPGYTLRLTAVQRKTKEGLQELAVEWLAPSGATLTGTSGAAAGSSDLPVVIASGTLMANGVSYVIEVAVIDLGNGEVGGIGLSAVASVLPRARGAFDDMLRTIVMTPAPP